MLLNFGLCPWAVPLGGLYHSRRSATSVSPLLTPSPVPRLLISHTGSSFPNLHQDLSSRLWLSQWQFILLVMQDFQALFSYLPACDPPRTVPDLPLQPVSQITCLLSRHNHKLSECLPVADLAGWIYLPVNSRHGLNVLQKTVSLDLLCWIIVRTTFYFHPAKWVPALFNKDIN